MARPTENELLNDDFWKAELGVDEDRIIDAKKAQALTELEALYIELKGTPVEDIEGRVYIAQRARNLRQLVRQYNAIKPIPF